MALNLNSLVATAKNIVNNLGFLIEVTHEPFTSADAYGNSQYGTKATLKVMSEYRKSFISAAGTAFGLQSAGGQALAPTITVMEPITIQMQDRFTFPDGSTPQISSVEGVLLSTGVPVTRVSF